MSTVADSNKVNLGYSLSFTVKGDSKQHTQRQYRVQLLLMTRTHTHTVRHTQYLSKKIQKLGNEEKHDLRL